MEEDEQLKEKEVNMKDISILLLWRSTISLSCFFRDSQLLV